VLVGRSTPDRSNALWVTQPEAVGLARTHARGDFLGTPRAPPLIPSGGCDRGQETLSIPVLLRPGRDGPLGPRLFRESCAPNENVTQIANILRKSRSGLSRMWPSKAGLPRWGRYKTPTFLTRIANGPIHPFFGRRSRHRIKSGAGFGAPGPLSARIPANSPALNPSARLPLRWSRGHASSNTLG